MCLQTVNLLRVTSIRRAALQLAIWRLLIESFTLERCIIPGSLLAAGLASPAQVHEEPQYVLSRSAAVCDSKATCARLLLTMQAAVQAGPSTGATCTQAMCPYRQHDGEVQGGKGLHPSLLLVAWAAIASRCARCKDQRASLWCTFLSSLALCRHDMPSSARAARMSHPP